MATIPQEYLDSQFDYGFTAIEDPDQSSPPPPVIQAPPVNTDEISGPILDRIKILEMNLSSALDILERLEQAGTPNLDTDEYKALIEKDVKAKLTQIEKMIMPLLVNLMKNPEKDYIHWPNRKPLIEKQIEKILAITRT